ncbi:MAG: hypothetical protein CO167_12140, partial [Candidatus Marinimicrobia bacterium CG_4_9_14_3_um_filter_48_9]
MSAAGSQNSDKSKALDLATSQIEHQF